MAVNPGADGTLSWRGYQNYATGERVEWTGASESEKPVSRTVISQSTEGGSTKLSLYMAVIAMAMSLSGGGVALRRSQKAK